MSQIQGHGAFFPEYHPLTPPNSGGPLEKSEHSSAQKENVISPNKQPSSNTESTTPTTNEKKLPNQQPIGVETPPLSQENENHAALSTPLFGTPENPTSENNSPSAKHSELMQMGKLAAMRLIALEETTQQTSDQTSLPSESTNTEKTDQSNTNLEMPSIPTMSEQTSQDSSIPSHQLETNTSSGEISLGEQPNVTNTEVSSTNTSTTSVQQNDISNQTTQKTTSQTINSPFATNTLPSNGGSSPSTDSSTAQATASVAASMIANSIMNNQNTLKNAAEMTMSELAWMIAPELSFREQEKKQLHEKKGRNHLQKKSESDGTLTPTVPFAVFEKNDEQGEKHSEEEEEKIQETTKTKSSFTGKKIENTALAILSQQAPSCPSAQIMNEKKKDVPLKKPLVLPVADGVKVVPDLPFKEEQRSPHGFKSDNRYKVNPVNTTETVNNDLYKQEQQHPKKDP